MRMFELNTFLSQTSWQQWLPFYALSIFGMTVWIIVLYRFRNCAHKISPSCPVVMMKGLVCLLPFLCGGFYLWSSILASAVLTVVLCVEAKVKKGLIVRLNFGMFTWSLVPAVYLLTGLWGVDAGGGGTGFTKFFPIALFFLALMQLDYEEREGILAILPISGACMVLISAVCAIFLPQVPGILVNGRLAGFFQYPNAFAIFLLCLAVYLPQTAYLPLMKYAIFSVLVIGIAMSGSRATWGIGFVIGIVQGGRYILHPGSRKKVGLTLTLGTGLFMAVLFLQRNILSRLLILPNQSSTFIGRLLYMKDALLQIMLHPFGLGYGGYYFSQGSFQTGVYAQRFVHNELIQLLLDVGWLPAFVVCICLVRTIWKSRFENRLVMLTLIGHAFFDFDFQFLSLLMLLLLAGHQSVDEKGCGVPNIESSRFLIPGLSVALAAGTCIMASDLAYQKGRSDVAVWLYPIHTEARIEILIHQEDLSSLENLANCILKDNKMVSIAYSAKANVAFSKGDGQEFICNKLKAIELAPYELEEYEDFAVKLYQLAQIYVQYGMRESGEYCMEYICSIPGMLQDVEKKTSALAWKIADKPQLEPTETMQKILEESQLWER